jgi:hypothetical protein
MLAIRAFGFGIVFLVLATGVSRAQFVVCERAQPGGLQQVSETLEDRGLYLLEPSRHCWSHVENVGLQEGTLRKLAPDEVQPFLHREAALFAYLIPRASYQSAIVVKERLFHPADVFAGEDSSAHPVSYAVPDVILKRAAVQSVCDRKGDLDNYRTEKYHGNVKITVNAYNRYHVQAYEYVPANDEIRQFHFLYPVGPACQSTDDPSTRVQYALQNLPQDPGTPFLSWALHLTAPSFRNPYYSKLLVENKMVEGENRIVSGTETLLGPLNYTIVRFIGDGAVGTRSEITIAELQGSITSTWQIDWK